MRSRLVSFLHIKNQQPCSLTNTMRRWLNDQHFNEVNIWMIAGWTPVRFRFFTQKTGRWARCFAVYPHMVTPTKNVLSGHYHLPISFGAFFKAEDYARFDRPSWRDGNAQRSSREHTLGFPQCLSYKKFRIKSGTDLQSWCLSTSVNIVRKNK